MKQVVSTIPISIYTTIQVNYNKMTQSISIYTTIQVNYNDNDTFNFYLHDNPITMIMTQRE